jgi:alkanesulfonate monooxygenase SsuD/methylene tetrahydromethanopterin reductase-like flavin-dependent oxidoreductase (luciferase family)
MKFGILYNTDYYPAAHQSPSNYYAQLLEQTELAEKLGFDAVWFGEHRARTWFIRAVWFFTSC